MIRGNRAKPRLSTQWCATHQMRYPTWLDAGRTQLGRCPECADEDVRAEAAAKRREEQANANAAGEA